MAIGIYGEGRLDGILDRMETPLRNGNWAAGMPEGATAECPRSCRPSTYARIR